jgi:hypothetical protein
VTVLTKFPSTTATASGFTGGWNQSTAVYSDSDTGATSYAQANTNSNSTQYGQFYSGFDFSSIPDGSTINSVTVYVSGGCPSSGVNSSSGYSFHTDVWADHNSGSASTQIGSTNTVTNPNIPIGTESWTERSFTVSPSLAQLKASGFAVRIRWQRTTNASNFVGRCDYLKVAVDYSEPTVSGTVAATTAASTASASGTRGVTGTASSTLTDSTSSASGTSGRIGTASFTAADSTVDASGSSVSGTVAATLAASTTSASAGHGVSGTSAITVDAATASATGGAGEQPFGSVEFTTGAASASASGATNAPPTGTIEITAADATSDVSGAAGGGDGVLGITTDDVTVAGLGSFALGGPVAFDTAASTASGDGAVGADGSAATSTAASVSEAEGSAYPAGPASVTLAAASVAAAGLGATPPAITGTVAITVSATPAAAGSAPPSGHAAFSTSSSVAAQGSPGSGGTATPNTEASTVESTGSVGAVGINEIHIRSSGGDYTSLSAWQNARVRNLVTENKIEKVILHDDWVNGLSDAVEISGWTTDAAHYIIITVADGDRHTGKPDTGFRLRSGQTWAPLINVAQAYTVLEYLEVENTESYANGATAIEVAAPNVVIRNCIAKAGRYGINCFSGPTSILDSLALDSEWGFHCGSADVVVRFYGCTAGNCVNGFTANGGGTVGYAVAKNCAAYCTGNPWVNGNRFSSASTNNATSSTSTTLVPGSNRMANVVAADFTNAAADDFSLTTSSKLVNAGADLTSDYAALTRASYPITAQDLKRQSRPQRIGWDIGAFEMQTDTMTGTAAIVLASATAEATGYQFVGSTSITTAASSVNGWGFGMVPAGTVSAVLDDAITTAGGGLVVLGPGSVQTDDAFATGEALAEVSGVIESMLEDAVALSSGMHAFGMINIITADAVTITEGTVNYPREPIDRNLCARCGFRFRYSQLRLEHTGLRVCKFCYDPAPVQPVVISTTDPEWMPAVENNWVPESFLLSQVFGFAGVGDIEIVGEGVFDLAGVAAEPAVGEIVIDATNIGVLVNLTGVDNGAEGLGFITIEAGANASLTGVAAEPGVGEIVAEGTFETLVFLTGVSASAGVKAPSITGNANVNVTGVAGGAGVGSISVNTGGTSLKWELGQTYNGRRIPAESEYTKIFLSQNRAKTQWNFRDGIDGSPTGNYMFIGDTVERQVQRLYVLGGNNIAVIGGKYMPSNSTVDEGAAVFIQDVRQTIYIEGVHIDNTLTTREAAKAITGISRANPAVVTCSAHGYSNGTRVSICGVAGMTQINNRVFTVANATTNTFQLSGVDSSAYSAYTSGGTVARINGEKDGIGYGSAGSGIWADCYIQNTIVQGVRGRQGGQHGDCVQRYRGVNSLNIFNFLGESTYQVFFLNPTVFDGIDYRLGRLHMENVSGVWSRLEQDWQWAYYFWSPTDATYPNPYPMTLTNVWLNECPYDEEWRFVYPNSEQRIPAVRSGNQITWNHTNISGHITVGTAPTFVSPSKIGIGYTHGSSPT